MSELSPLSPHSVQLGSFLKERNDRYSPEEANKLGLKQVAKIDFSGNVHLTDAKTTRTPMILVRNGDLVISGINVEKGAISVYSGKEDVTATIHYSSYSIDEDQINPQYLRWFLQSKIFREIIGERGKIGIKTELKPKKFLKLTIPLPNLGEQRKIVERLDSIGKKISELIHSNNEIEKYLQWFYRTVLRNAVSGKLIRQNSEDGQSIELLSKIRMEKNRWLAKEETLQDKIQRDETYQISKNKAIPFELPKSWEWSTLGEICYEVSSGSTPSKEHFRTDKGIPYLKVYNIIKNKIDFCSRPQYIDESIHRTKNRRSILYPGDVIMNIVGPPLGKIAIVPDSYREWNCNQAIVFFRAVLKEMNRWIYLYLSEGSFLESIDLVGTVGQDNISITKSRNIPIPIPPLAEQKRIVKRIDFLERLYQELIEKVEKNQEFSRLLMEALKNEALLS